MVILARMIFWMCAGCGRAAPLMGIAAVLALIAPGGCGKSSGESANSAQPAKASPEEPPPSEQQIQAALESASSYIQRRDLASAQKILEQLVLKAPRDVRGFELLGQVLYSLSMEAHQRGDAEQARDLRTRAASAYQEAVKLEPESAGLHNSAGMILLVAGNEDAALEMFHRAGVLEPSNPQHPLFEAQILIKKKRLDEAQSALERVLAIDGQEPHAYASLAVIAMERGDWFKASDLIERARAMDPDNFDFLAQQARVIRRSGNPKRSLEMLSSLPAAMQSRPMIAREMAASYVDLNEPAKAAAAWERVYEAQHGAAEAWFAAAQAADLYIQAGRRDDALIWLRQAELLAPREQQVKDLRSKLAESAPAES